VPSFGDPQARLLILGLAPAAHGGNRTGRSFTGDRSGEWLYGALHAHGFANQPTATHRDDNLRLHDCFIAQVLHCAPPANKPERQEIHNCQPYLLAELRLLTNVQVIVPLGGIAFDAYLRACKHLSMPVPVPRPRFGHGQLCRLPNGCTLLPSYHPSQQNTSTGRLTRPMLDQIFATARRLLETG
jgi:uracil-DNA glycosylase family 4